MNDRVLEEFILSPSAQAGDRPAAVRERDPVLQVRGLTAAFAAPDGWRPVVRGLDFDIAAGRTLAIVGESGSGKSVTALSLLRLLDPRRTRTGGSARLAGRELLGPDDTALREVRGRDIAMIFQEPMTSLNPVLTVGTQLAEVLVHHRGLSWTEARAEAIRLFDRMRIPAAAMRYDEPPHRLSGGMRQRVMIAIALACRPKLLVADEPTTALDVTIQAQILDLIKELQAEQGTGVLTHDMGVVAEIADDVLVMQAGRAVESGPTPTLFARPAHPRTRALLAAVPRLGEAPPADSGAALPDAPQVLAVESLTVRFDVRGGWLGRTTARVHAAEGVTFGLQAGETLALVGESGSGKSTVGRSIVGLVKPTSGRILLDGEDGTGLRGDALRARRRQVQMVFQDPGGSLDPRQPVGEALAEPLRAHHLVPRSAIRERVSDLLAAVGLDPAMASRLPHAFSGGQRQRLCIARALALEPRVIVADEAVSALDVSTKAQVVDLLAQLQATRGLAYLFISHDLAVVERISHRVAVMFLGEIVEIGPRASIFGNPRHPYTRRLLDAVPLPDPGRRRQRHAGLVEEPRSAVHAVGAQRLVLPLREVAPDHWVRDTP